MKLNPDCVRTILERIESLSNGRVSFIFTKEQPILEHSSYSWEEQVYHFSYCNTQGYFEGSGISLQGDSVHVRDLSPLGHQVLVSFRKQDAFE